MGGYAHPETLVETGWVADHRHDPALRIIEVDVDITTYRQGHIPGALDWDWSTQ
jgi:thiosulfate/3-mercaptopyruvate sulfurtransferase